MLNPAFKLGLAAFSLVGKIENGFSHLKVMKVQNSKLTFHCTVTQAGSSMQSLCLQHALDEKQCTALLYSALNLLMFA